MSEPSNPDIGTDVPDSERIPPDLLFHQVLSDRFQLSDKILGSGSFGHAFVCYDFEDPAHKTVCIAKVETVPTESCLYHHETQLEHEHNVYAHLHQYKKIKPYLPKIHLFLQHRIDPETIVPVMVMERVGKDLLTVLRDDNLPYFKLRTLGLLGIQMVQALKYMHEMFIVHRDIKPQNIMLVKHKNIFQVKLIDFGLSMPIPENTDPHRELYRSTTCTYAFASWRQHFRHVCSARTDMESFVYTWTFLAGAPIPWRDAGLAPTEQLGGKTAKRELIGHIKRETKPSDLCFPFDEAGRDPYGSLLSELLDHVLTLPFDGIPNYKKFKQYFTWLSKPI